MTSGQVTRASVRVGSEARELVRFDRQRLTVKGVQMGGSYQQSYVQVRWSF